MDFTLLFCIKATANLGGALGSIKAMHQEMTDQHTSPEFKARWGRDAIAGFREDCRQTRYFVCYTMEFTADLAKELAHFARTGGAPLEPGDFVLPVKAWQPEPTDLLTSR